MFYVVEMHLTKAINSVVFPWCSFALKEPSTSLTATKRRLQVIADVKLNISN